MTRTLAFVLSASLAACAGQAEVRYSGNAAAPELVVMDTDPSVMVVANAEEPIFFVENTYWLYRDARWFRSRSHRSGWRRTDAPPDHLRRIDRPLAYVHYRTGAQRTTLNQRDQVPQSDPERAEPTPDSDPTLLPGQPPTRPMPPMRPTPPDQVPSVPPERDRPDQQIAPDPDRAPISPGDHSKRRPDPDNDRRDPDPNKRPGDKN